MAYLGTPIDTRNTFQSLQGKRFNGDGSTTAFTLDVAPSSTLDIEVFVGNVRQDPNSAYTLSGTTLTFTGAPPSGTNNIYVVHQAKAVGTIDVPTGGVVAGSLGSSVLTGQTDIGGAIADADLFLLDDGAGGTLRKTAASRIKTYIGDNTPSFKVILTTAQSIAHNTSTVIAYNTEIYDTDNAVSSGTFTCPSGKAGKYFFTAVGGINSSSDISNVTLGLSKNTASSTTGTDGAFTFIEYYHKGSSAANTHRSVSATFDLAETDTVTVRIYQNVGSSQNTTEDNRTAFSGFKLL